MTQNYVKLLLKYLRENSNGMLVHCISGWDRTPLFISLLRILLWADGAIHQSLNAKQMLYFTLAYDWYLFGHNLPGRSPFAISGMLTNSLNSPLFTRSSVQG